QQEIRIGFCRDSGGIFTLEVGDNGIGLPENFEVQKTESLGIKLVDVLVKQLKGTLLIGATDGARFTITFDVRNSRGLA
ncbi:MAG TPA: hypothetical protein PKA48_10205, partial [Candidatus Obscuribacter sp.]|nr:hypothetical protein [Candidatus Obscuribacter sp.]